MYSILNMGSVKIYTIYNELDSWLFQKYGRFMQIFQLWIDKQYRRLGLATKLKLKFRLEEVAEFHEVNLIYTHTEEKHHHVIDLIIN